VACADIGLTVQTLQQAVLDVRAAIAWLLEQGASEVHLVGASLGSCVAALVSAHEPAVTRCVALHAAPDLADVVWTGSNLGHVRDRIAPHMSLEGLRRAWVPVSPGSFARRLSRRGLRMLVASVAHDTVLLRRETGPLVAMLREAGADVSHTVLGCGHQTLAWFPFGAVAVLQARRFLQVGRPPDASP